MKKFYYSILGAATGVANGLFGSGGGVIAVPMFQRAGLKVKKSHASSLALTLPLSIVSAIFYADNFNFGYSLPLLPFGLAGAVIGALWLKKIPNTLLKRVFGILLVIAGGRIILF